MSALHVSPIRFAVLGLLLERPSYPYELDQIFKRRIGPAWQLSSAAIGQTIGRLREEGLIERTERRSTRQGEADSWLYAITPRGVDVYRSWQTANRDTLRPIRDELLVDIALAADRDLPALLEKAERRERLCLDELKELRGQLADLPVGHEGEPAANCWRTFLTTKHAMSQREGEIEWLTDVGAVIRRRLELEGGSD